MTFSQLPHVSPLLAQTRPEVQYSWLPILVAAIIGYFIAHCFISVYEVGKDASNIWG